MKKLAVLLALTLVFPAGLLSTSAADTPVSNEIKVSDGCSYTYTGQHSINGGVITLRKLEIEQIMPELDQNLRDSQGIGYYIDEESKEAYVSSVTETISGSITLPNKVNYKGVIYPVIGIESHAFYRCDNLTEVTIPDGYTMLSTDTFAFCSSLRKINLPASLSYIMMNPFFECPAIAEIVIDANNQYYLSEDNVVFNKDKTELVVYPVGKTDTEYTIPSSVTTINDYAFYSAKNLQKVNIPNSVKYIGIDAFAFSGLTSVSLPDNIETLFKFTFYNCNELVTVKLPKNLSYIDFHCFSNCYSLLNFEIDESNAYFSSENGILFSKNGEELVLYPAGKNASSYTIPDGVQTIGIGAFEGNIYLESVTIPESVTRIDFSAFRGCSSLRSFHIPNKAMHIAADAFNSTKWYNDQPNGIIYLGKIAYGYKGYLPPVITIRNGTLAIADYAFDFTEITEVSLPDGLELIGDGAFAYCYELQSIEIPDSLLTSESPLLKGAKALQE